MAYSCRRITSTTSADSSAAAACRQVLRLVEQCEEYGVVYADPICRQWSELTFTIVLKKLGIRWEYCTLNGLLEIVWPPICGTHLVQLEREQTPPEKHFALRHAAGHVLAGDCTMSRNHDGHDWRSRAETVADGFALIDLISDMTVRDRLRAGWSWRDVIEWLESQVRTFGPTWGDDRAFSRTQDRLWLFAQREGCWPEGNR